jgi:hypothetical protein
MYFIKILPIGVLARPVPIILSSVKSNGLALEVASDHKLVGGFDHFEHFPTSGTSMMADGYTGLCLLPSNAILFNFEGSWWHTKKEPC